MIVFVGLLMGAYTAYGYMVYKQYSEQMPLEQIVEQVRSQPDYVEYDDLPRTLIRATVSIEDRRFFDHDGVDIIGLVRAIFSQFNDNFLRSGGSTITQQLAKNLYGMYDSTSKWKAAEFHFARELESRYSKKEIFAIYVNVINYGNNYTGISQASLGYFGVVPEDLNDGQCTILAGIPQVPTQFELTTPEKIQAARERQLLVLDAMIDMKYLNQAQANEIYNEPIF